MTRMIESGRLVSMLAVVSGFAVLIHVLIFMEHGKPFDFSDLWELATSGSFAAGLAYFLLDRWLWKWPILQGWLIEFPDLTGTWEGEAEGYTFKRTHKETVTINFRI